jgi:uncharacterized protein YbjT (DUF2867 family)
MSDLVLVTGATGKTGKSLVAQLEAKGVACRAASRGGEPPFDWMRPETWDAALLGVTAIYLVAPPTVDDPYSKIIEFLKSAIRIVPRRLVFLGMASLPAGGFAHGQVHQWLKDNSEDWAVLSPSAFMQNFSEGPTLATIREEATVYSNTGTGRVPFISAEDIASAALGALLAPAPLNRDFTITGGESISYDRVAELISHACGRPISHTHISTEMLIDRFLARGLPEATARFLAFGYQTIASGYQDRMTEDFTSLTGKRPTTFQAFAEANAGVWKQG